MIIWGSMLSGKRRRLKSASATKAVSGVSSCPDVVYAMKVKSATRKGAAVQKRVVKAVR